MRHPLQFGLLERPVLDAELLALVDRLVRGQSLGTAHDIDRVQVELSCYPGGLLVFAVAEHADAGHQDDQWVGSADRWRVVGRVPVVVGLIVVAVRSGKLVKALDRLLDSRSDGKVEYQRADLRTQEMVGAGRTEGREPDVLCRCKEVEHDVGVVVVADHRTALAGMGVDRGDASNSRRKGRCSLMPFALGKRLVAIEWSTERLGLGVLGDVRRGGVDDPERVALSLVTRVTPRGDPVPAENAADRIGMFGLDRGNVQSQLETRAAPRHPHHAVTEDLGGQLLAVGGRRDRDSGIGMKMVDVRRIDETVHCGIDRRCRTALAMQAEVERGDHLVFLFDPGIDVDERAHPVEPEHGQPRLLQGA